MPGLPGGIWTTHKRDSFKMSEAAHRNVARDVRLGAPVTAPSGLRTANTPSPSVSDGAGSLPFAIPLQPTPKAHRSLSHSQGQREMSVNPAGTLAGATSGAPVLPLGLLAEENDTDSDSEQGEQLMHTMSHPAPNYLQRSSTISTGYEYLHAVGNGRGHSPAEPVGVGHGGTKLGLDTAFLGLGLGELHCAGSFIKPHVIYMLTMLFLGQIPLIDVHNGNLTLDGTMSPTSTNRGGTLLRTYQRGEVLSRVSIPWGS